MDRPTDVVTIFSDPTLPDALTELALVQICERRGVRAEYCHKPISSITDVLFRRAYIISYEYLGRDSAAIRTLEQRHNEQSSNFTILPFALHNTDEIDIGLSLGRLSSHNVIKDGLDRLVDDILSRSNIEAVADDMFEDISEEIVEPVIVHVHLVLIRIAAKQALANTDAPNPIRTPLRLRNRIAPDVATATRQMFEQGIKLLRQRRQRSELELERISTRYIDWALSISDQHEHGYFAPLIKKARNYGAMSLEILEALCSPLATGSTFQEQDISNRPDLQLTTSDYVQIGRRWYRNILRQDSGIRECIGQKIWIDPYSGNYLVGDELELPEKLAECVGAHRMQHFYSRRIEDSEQYPIPTLAFATI